MSRIDRNDQTSLEEFIENEFKGNPIDGQGANTGSTSGNRVASCQRAEDCGSNHLCIGGTCVSAEAVNQGLVSSYGNSATANTFTSTSRPGGNSGGSSNCGSGSDNDGLGCGPDNPESGGCSSGGSCGEDQGKGSLNPNELNCCGPDGQKAPKYRCNGGPWQCEPCAVPEKECNYFCDASYKLFGVSGPGCTNQDGAPLDCGDCKDCGLNNTCVNWSGAPCWCKSGDSGCPKCEKCDANNGRCYGGPGICKEVCNVKVQCECGDIYTAIHSQDRNHPVGCYTQGRRNLYQKMCIDGGGNHCPQRDPCSADPNNPCEKSCRCTHRHTTCDAGRPPCPSGYSCTPLGYIFRGASQEDGSCQDTQQDENGNWFGGGITWFARECLMREEGEGDCNKCDCNCENDCPDCYNCSAEGKCVRDEDCDDPCEVPCDGQCCENGETCQPGVQYEILDACHYAGGRFTAPANVTIRLEHTTDISAAGAVCGRFHTHCRVVGSDGKTYGTHLDCQRGLRRLESFFNKPVCG